mgnify:FL=1|jgi:hypothetical protein|tara:strand:+ start:34410 stop:34658 length:249 start_codon:yes stop_codon:yes gene_type:complete
MTTLRELYYFNRESGESEEDNSYEPRDDQSTMRYDDTRKTRLTLRAINKIRKAGEQNDEEYEKELHYLRQMYAAPPSDAELV